MRDQSIIREAFRQQSQWCDRLGSPFTALLMAVLGDHLDETTRTGRDILNWDGAPNALADAVPLRLAGALHAKVRAGRLPKLAECYPPHPLPDAAHLAEVVAEAMRDADEELHHWLQFAPQTNETARSAMLYSGFMAIAAKTGLPLHLFELGASAGLNLISDRYSYTLGGIEAGHAGSELTLAPHWQGPPPPAGQVEVVARQGCDRAPLDVQDPRHRERLVAYVWPDQPDRLARVEAAIILARRENLALDQADAADWVEAEMALEPAAGVVRVLFHSIAWQYFPDEDQARITRHMEAAGRHATPQAPLAWLSFEQRGDEGPALCLRLWPDGQEQILARADAHVRNVTWLA